MHYEQWWHLSGLALKHHWQMRTLPANFLRSMEAFILARDYELLSCESCCLSCYSVTTVPSTVRRYCRYSCEVSWGIRICISIISFVKISKLCSCAAGLLLLLFSSSSVRIKLLCSSPLSFAEESVVEKSHSFSS